MAAPAGLADPQLVALLGQQAARVAGRQSLEPKDSFLDAVSLEKLLKIRQLLSQLPENQPTPEQLAAQPGPLTQLALLSLLQRRQRPGGLLGMAPAGMAPAGMAPPGGLPQLPM